MRSIYTTAACWSWVVPFFVWLPGYFLSKPGVHTADRTRQRIAAVLPVGGYARTKALIPFVW